MQTARDASQDDADLKMTPMIDVTFLLLIFFMCTLEFKTLDGKLAAYLPKDVGIHPQPTDPIEKVEILVTVERPGARLKPSHPVPRLFQADDTGRYVWNTEELVEEHPSLGLYPVRELEYRVGPFATRDLEELRKRLAKTYRDRKSRGEESPPATIDARAGTVYEDVADVLDNALDAGFEEITFVGSYEKTGQQ